MSKNYHLRFDPRLGHGICAICRIPCACVACTSMLDQPWISGTPSKKKSRYQPVTDFTYWLVLGSYNNFNIIHLTPKPTPFEDFDEIHQFVLDGISDNISSLFQSGNYGFITTYYTTTNGFYVIHFISEACTIQNNGKIHGTFISAGELVSKAQYFCSAQENSNWYWEKQSLRYNIIVPTCTIIHPRLDVVIIKHVQEIPKTVCNRIQ